MDNNNILININFQEKNISHVTDNAVFDVQDFFDVHQTVSTQQVRKLVDKSFDEKLHEEKNKIEVKIRKEMDAKINGEIAAQKLKLTAEYTRKMSSTVERVKKVLMNEFSMTDPYALEALVIKCLHNLDEEKPEFIFVSKDNLEIIKSKISNDKISIAGYKIPIAVGHGLTNDQVMIEGQSAVVVSDLGVLIDNYFTEKSDD